MKRYLTEVIGTFFIVLTIGLTVLDGSPFAPLAIGGVYMVMVYMGGHVSGGHYNPAVSLAATMRGTLPGAQWVPYAVSQVIGALAGALIVYAVRGESFAPEPGIRVPGLAALLVEFLFTFALCLTVLNTMTSKRTEGNSFYGLAIGCTIAVAVFAGGPVSGGAFNPAVGLGLTLVHAFAGGGALGHVWLYLLGPLLGGVLAAVVFRVQDEDA